MKQETEQSLSPLQKAFLALKDARLKLEKYEAQNQEPIAIIGMGCRFPGGANSPEALWRILRDGVDAITEVPKDRWDIDAYYDPEPGAIGKMYARKGGFINEVDTFDAQFFKISPREAMSLDPQQRLLLEVSWQALENAHQVPEELYKSPTGVFTGVFTNDYARKLSAAEDFNAHSANGNVFSFTGGRLSYFLGLTGPSLAVDAACASSLVSVHLACQSLRNQECNLALAGGVNVMVSPEISIIFSQARMLSPEGYCKTFDAAADGYVRGEGCGVIVLKRLSDAIKNQDNILAVIRGSATNHGGPSGGLTVPSGSSQQKVIRQALENGGIEPSQVSYIEAHGTGTSLGDPIEVGAIGAVFGRSHSQEHPLMISSLKTNMGHLEAAAGIAGLIKVVLQLQHQEIVPHLHLKEPNPYINWDELPVDVPTQLTPWSVDSPKRIAGVSSFGLNGSNAHVVLEEAPVQESQAKVSDLDDRPCHLLTLSAKCEKALQHLVQDYRVFLDNNSTDAIADICFSANTGRSHFNHRLAIITSDQQELTDKLAKISAGEEPSGVFSGKLPSNNQSPKIAFLFTGQGSQYVNMARQLYETQPVFRRTLDQCEQILQSDLDKSFLEVIYPEKTKEINSSVIDQTAYTQPALFAIEYALAQLWKSWDIKPDVVMGHSVGEYVAATMAGVFSLEDGLKLIAHRGRLMQQLPNDGAMVSVMASVEQVQEAISGQPEVAIAAINGPVSVVISGEAKAIGMVRDSLESQGIKTKQLQVSHAFHSPLMEPMLAEFEAVASQITYNQPRIPLISNVTGARADESISTASYWVNHVRQPVKFAQSMETLHQQGYELFLEIGPKPILLGMGRQCVPEDGGAWLPSLRPGQEDWQQMLQSLGELYVRGVKVDWLGFDRDYARNKVVLPTYPFQRQRYWIETDENESRKADTSLENKTTSIVDWLNDGNNQQLAQQLEKVGKFSPEQVNLLPELLEILVKQHQEQLTAATIKDWLYQVQWKPLLNTQPKTSIQPGHWLIFADSTLVGENLAQQLQQQGCECSLVYRGERYQKLGSGSYQLNPTEPQEFEQLIQAIGENSKFPLERVIHLWSLDSPTSKDLTITSLEQAQRWGCGTVLHSVKALIKTNNVPQLWLVTRGTQSVQSKTEEVSVAASPLWGMGRVISLEHPQLWGGMVDLDPQTPASETETLLQLLADKNQQEDHLGLRGEGAYIARLVKQSPPISQPVSLESHATYLITGGLGALGLHTAKWMVEKGARHLVLTGRKQPSAKVQQTIEELQKAGAQVLVLCGDISQEEDATKILESIEASLPTLRGVIHAAGVLDDGLLQQMSWEQFIRVMAPKVEGAWHLHSLTQNLPLDFFVCFSSMASLLGSPGQGNYAAANAFMDALVHHRRGMGLPGLSINWGPWAQAGMAANLDSRHQGRMVAKGIMTLSSEQGLQVLGQLLEQSFAQVGVLPVEWSVFQEQFSLGNQMPLVSELVRETKFIADKPAAPQTEIFTPLLQMSSTQRQEFLNSYLRKLIAAILQMPPEQIPLTDSLLDSGMDSLMVMEAINRIGRDLQLMLYPREFYERPKINSLAKYLVTEFERSHIQVENQHNQKLSFSTSVPFSPTSPVSPSVKMGNKLPSMAFILSSPRSGSTLLRVMLAGHSAIFSPPELHLLPFNTMGERQQEVSNSYLEEGLQRAFMKLKGIDARTSQELVKQLTADNVPIDQVYAMLQNLAGERLLVDKSPTYGMHRQILERAEDLFENPKYIHLVRHPYAVIESFARMRMDKLIGADHTDPYEIAESIWANSNQNIRNFCEQIEQERHHLIRYEDLVLQPEKVMKGLCEFLAIPFDPAILKPYEGERMTDGVHSGKSMSIGDPNFLQHKQIDAKLGETWKKIKLPHQLRNLAVQVAISLGYQLPWEPKTSSSTTTMKEHFLNVRGLNLCLCTWGPETGPLVLCLHGILDQGAAWSEVAERLAEKGYRVVAPDLRGHGRSAHAGKEASYNLLDFVGDVDALAEKLTDVPFTLVGHSLGSIIAAVFASARSQTVKDLILVETILPGEVSVDETPERIATHLDYLASPPKHPVFPDLNAAAERLHKATPALSKSRAMKLAQRITEPCTGGLRWGWDPLLSIRMGFKGISRSQYLGLLSQIKVPLTLVYGDQSNFNREEDLSQQQAAMSQAKRIVVSGGHNLHLETASTLAQVIING